VVIITCRSYCSIMETPFYDINKFPKGYGILVFPISIARIDNGTGQDPQQCLDYIKHFSPNKISEPKVGLNLIYSDFLYLNSAEQAKTLKKKFTNVILKHKNLFEKLIKREQGRFQIQQAFSYEVWNQLYLSYSGDFDSDFREFKRIYEKDELFQQYLKDDAVYCKRELTDEQIDFFLEEHLLFYFISKKQISLPNEYVQGREQWVLCCYPGAPLKGEIYTYKLNPFKLQTVGNKYENSVYDLTAKKLIDTSKVDLNSYNYTY
jgi:hypothetical protein